MLPFIIILIILSFRQKHFVCGKAVLPLFPDIKTVKYLCRHRRGSLCPPDFSPEGVPAEDLSRSRPPAVEKHSRLPAPSPVLTLMARSEEGEEGQWVFRREGIAVFQEPQGICRANTGGQILKKAVHRADQEGELFRRGLRDPLDFIKRPGLSQEKLSDPGAEKRLHGSSCSQGLPDIFTEGADIGPFGTADPHGDQRRLYLFHPDRVDGDPPGLSPP